MVRPHLDVKYNPDIVQFFTYAQPDRDTDKYTHMHIYIYTSKILF